ncbi:alpha/beta fold hydrolase [Propylenella binzhouense]|uniref:Alpha/beta fold hydrolase n=1 Tax=Propylenella binzhouense TaxID=2555902 RepID=A0A964WT48_9HYPH|nr:alpha/beta hydrolase [Propylenella binzhouense]MYZ47571.1 alpha/beta fold hydrolase [Propylenella binzhouense]
MQAADWQAVDVGGARISYRDAGSGDAVVLVHGIGTDCAVWDEVFGSLASEHRVIAWNAPGYGASDPLPDASPAIRDYSRALAGLLAALDLGSAHLVGHSIGAAIVAGLSACSDLAAKKVVLLHPVAGFGGRPFEERERLRRARLAEVESLGMAEFAGRRGPGILGSGLDAARRRAAVSNMARVPAGGYLQLWNALCGSDLHADLPLIRSPALVVAGEEDPVAPAASCREIAAAIPAAFEMVGRVGHSLPVEDPLRLAAILRRFLGGSDDGR